MLAEATRLRQFDRARLDAIPAQLQAFIDGGVLPGIVTLTWRAGEVAQQLNIGARRLGGPAMTRDTIFRIASMTKPVTTVAAMMLVEEGRLSLSDEITRWMPEFSAMQVLRDPKGALTDVSPAPRAITVEDLMTHRSGLAYAFSSSGPIAQAHEQALGHPLGSALTPDQWLAALGQLPLTYPPGERMHYSHSTEVLGFLVARIEGKTLAEVLRERIFKPLGMVDTGFYTPAEKQDRLAGLYGWDDKAEALRESPLPEGRTEPVYAAGGGGLHSTVDDYLKFACMLLNDGEVDGVRLLKAESVRDMRTNRLTSKQREDAFLGMPMWVGMGFGLGLSVVDKPEQNLLGVGSVGSFGWPGAFGTWWQADPVEEMVTIWMIQHAIPLTPDAGAAIAAGRGMAGRMALPQFQRATYAALS